MKIKRNEGVDITDLRIGIVGIKEINSILLKMKNTCKTKLPLQNHY